MREAAGDLQTGVGAAPGAVVVAALPVRVGLDGRDLGALGADLVGGGTRAHRQQQARADPIGMADASIPARALRPSTRRATAATW